MSKLCVRVCVYGCVSCKNCINISVQNVRGNQTSERRGEWQDGGREGGRGHKRSRFCSESRCEVASCEKTGRDFVSYRISRGQARARTSAHVRNGASLLGGTPNGKGRARNYLAQVRKIESRIRARIHFTLYCFAHGPNAFPLSARRAVLPFADKVLRRHHCGRRARRTTISPQSFHLKQGTNAP
jgi:hypothetical protein